MVNRKRVNCTPSKRQRRDDWESIRVRIRGGSILMDCSWINRLDLIHWWLKRHQVLILTRIPLILALVRYRKARKSPCLLYPVSKKTVICVIQRRSWFNFLFNFPYPVVFGEKKKVLVIETKMKCRLFTFWGDLLHVITLSKNYHEFGFNRRGFWH